MPRISWNEIQDRAVEFASRWAGETYEKGNSQPFWSEFLTIYGVDHKRHGAFFEYAIKKGSGKQGFILHRAIRMEFQSIWDRWRNVCG